VIWAILGEAHETTFATGLVKGTYDYLESHFWATVVLGFVWLTFVVFWPSIKKVKWLPEFKTLHERVHEASVQLSALAQSVAVLQNSKPVERIPELYARTLTLAAITQQIGPAGIWMDGLSSLIYQADQCHHMFETIRKRYPNSDVAKQPFSNGWRPHTGKEPDSEAMRMGLAWSAYLGKHVRSCKDFKPTHGKILDGKSTQQVLAYVEAWNSGDVSGEKCLEILDQHRLEMEAVYIRQAANLADATLAFRTSS
jgi:hypothetical protein